MRSNRTPIRNRGWPHPVRAGFLPNVPCFDGSSHVPTRSRLADLQPVREVSNGHPRLVADGQDDLLEWDFRSAALGDVARLNQQAAVLGGDDPTLLADTFERAQHCSRGAVALLEDNDVAPAPPLAHDVG